MNFTKWKPQGRDDDKSIYRTVKFVKWIVFPLLILVGVYMNYKNSRTVHSLQVKGETSSAPTACKDEDASQSNDEFVDRSWCPKAECLNSPVCHPCRRRFLIIIATGRSASTTLTWMMDLLPGVRMSGENNNALNLIRTMMNQITKSPFQMKPPVSKLNAWSRNPMPDGSLACVSQHMIEAITPPIFANGTVADAEAQANEIIGFKTIKLARTLNDGQAPEVAHFLKSHFPCARYLINYRTEVDKQAESRRETFQLKANISEIEKMLVKDMQFLDTINELLGDQSMVLDSSKWTKDVNVLNEAVEWLGFEGTCAFPRLLGLNTGPTKGKDIGASRSLIGQPKGFQHSFTHLELDSKCKYVGRNHTVR